MFVIKEKENSLVSSIMNEWMALYSIHTATQLQYDELGSFGTIYIHKYA